LTRSIGGSACATRRARERDNEAHWFIVAAASIDETSYVQAIHLWAFAPATKSNK